MQAWEIGSIALSNAIAYRMLRPGWPEFRLILDNFKTITAPRQHAGVVILLEWHWQKPCGSSSRWREALEPRFQSYRSQDSPGELLPSVTISFRLVDDLREFSLSDYRATARQGHSIRSGQHSPNNLRAEKAAGDAAIASEKMTGAEPANEFKQTTTKLQTPTSGKRYL